MPRYSGTLSWLLVASASWMACQAQNSSVGEPPNAPNATAAPTPPESEPQLSDERDLDPRDGTERATAAPTESAAASSAPAPDAAPKDNQEAWDDDDGELRTFGRSLSTLDPNAPPPEVSRELEHIDKRYEELPEVTLLPDFLSLDDVVALVPRSGFWDAEQFRSDVRQQLESRSGDVLRGGTIDDDQKWYALWLSFGWLEGLLAVYDARGRRTAQLLVPSRSHILFRDVVRHSTAEQDAVPELFISAIEGDSVCCVPSRWDVYRLGRNGQLLQIFSHPKDYAHIGPGVRYDTLFHFDFTSDEKLFVQDLLLEDAPRFEFTYNRSVGRYTPTPETRKLKAQLKREEAERHAEETQQPGFKSKLRPPPVEIGY